MKNLADIQPYRVMFVDGMNLCARSYHGMAGLSYNGRPTGMMFGVARLVLDWRKRSPGMKIIFIWEGRNSWRKNKYPIYKAHRRKADDGGDKEIYFECVDRVRAALPSMGVDQHWAETYEADDTVWSSLSYWIGEKKLFVSTDWDWWPLSVHMGDILYQNDILTEADMVRRFTKKFNCDPIKMDRLWLFKVLTGDPSDGISGVPMFPKKLAANLCNDPGVTLETLEDTLKRWEKKTWAEKVRVNQWLIERNLDLITPRHPPLEHLERVEGKFDIEGFENVLLHDGMADLYERLVKGW